MDNMDVCARCKKDIETGDLVVPVYEMRGKKLFYPKNRMAHLECSKEKTDD